MTSSPVNESTEKSTEPNSPEFDWLQALRAAESDSQAQTIEPFAPNTGIEISFEGSEPLLSDSELEPDPDTGRFAFLPNRAFKLGLMLAGAIAALGVGWYTTFGSAKPQTEAASSLASSASSVGEADKMAQLEHENNNLKAESAFGKQARDLEQLNQPQPQPNPKRPPQPIVVRRSPTTPPPQPSRSVRLVTPPPPPVLEPERRIRRTPQSDHEIVPISRPVPPPLRRTILAPVPTSVPPWRDNSDPQQAQQTWLMAARLGSYGGDSSDEEVPLPTSSSVGSGDTEFYGTDAADEPPPVTAVGTKGASSSSEVNLEQSVLEGRPLNLLELAVGTKVRGRLLNAIVWDDPQLVEGSPVSIELQEDLRDRQGQVLVAAGEPVSAQIVQARASGIVLLSIEELPSAEGTIPLKRGTIVVQQPDGMPLVAERRHQGEEEGGGGIDLGSLALDLFGAVTPLLSGGGGGDGFYRDAYQLDRFENLYERHFQQQQDPYAVPSRLRSATIWQIPAGTEVELMVREGVKIYQ